jgi:hypothetical protein
MIGWFAHFTREPACGLSPFAVVNMGSALVAGAQAFEGVYLIQGFTTGS